MYRTHNGGVVVDGRINGSIYGGYHIGLMGNQPFHPLMRDGTSAYQVPYSKPFIQVRGSI